MCLLRLRLAQAAAACGPASSRVLAGRLPGTPPLPGECHGPQGRVTWMWLPGLCTSQPSLCCSVSKASRNEGYKSHLDEFPWAFLNLSFLLILRLAKKQNFHHWEMLTFCVWLFC